MSNFTCPNCSAPLDAHESGCALHMLTAVLSDRGEHSDEQIEQLLLSCDVAALWEDLGKIVDKFGEGAYA